MLPICTIFLTIITIFLYKRRLLFFTGQVGLRYNFNARQSSRSDLCDQTIRSLQNLHAARGSRRFGALDEDTGLFEGSLLGRCKSRIGYIRSQCCPSPVMNSGSLIAFKSFDFVSFFADFIFLLGCYIVGFQRSLRRPVQ